MAVFVATGLMLERCRAGADCGAETGPEARAGEEDEGGGERGGAKTGSRRKTA
jgi:hypothetical protein